MLRNIFVSLIFIGLYYIFYKLGGFELAVIIALGQIMASLALFEKDSKK